MATDRGYHQLEQDEDGDVLNEVVKERADLLVDVERKTMMPIHSTRICGLSLPLSSLDPIRRFWDVLVAISLFYTATVSIYVISFIGLTWVNNPAFWLERGIDAIWLVDIVLNFVTTYHKSDRTYETNLRKCALRYLKGWFIIDFFALLPWDIIAYLSARDEPSSYWLILKILRLLRLLKIMKVVRLFETSVIFVRLEVLFCVKYAVLRIFVMVVGALFVAHWVACLFYFFAFVQVGTPGIITWIDDLQDASSNFDYYVGSLYFSVYTITTIGFGDVTPNTTLERVYTTIIMLLGAAIFTYLLSNVNALVADLGVASQQYRALMDQLSDYAKLHDLDPAIHFKIRQYFKTVYRNREMNSQDNVVLDAMTPALRSEVAISVYGPWVRKVDWFEDSNDRTLGFLCSVIEHRTYAPQDFIFRNGDESEGIFIIARGEAERLKVDGETSDRLYSGDVIGQYNLVLGRRRNITVQALNFCSVLFLRRDHVLWALETNGKYEGVLKGEVRRLWTRAVFVAEEQARLWHIANELHRFVKVLEETGLDRGEALNALAEKVGQGSVKEYLLKLSANVTDEGDARSRTDVDGNEDLTPEQIKAKQIDDLKAQVVSTHAMMGDILAKLESLSRE